MESNIRWLARWLFVSLFTIVKFMHLLCWSLPSNSKVNLRSYIPEKFLNISFTRSQKGRPILLYAGKKFRREQRFNDGREYWRCMTDKCNARMTLQFGRIKKMKAEHKCDALNIKSKPKYTERLWEVGENYCRTGKEQEKMNKIEFVKMWTSVVVLDVIYYIRLATIDSEIIILFLFFFFQGMDFIYSQRGKPLIVIDNYLYRKNRGAYWRCIRCTKYKCKSRLILRPNQDPIVAEKHSHGPEREKINWGRKVKSTAGHKLGGGRILLTKRQPQFDVEEEQEHS